MKIALVHEYLNQFGGAERVLQVLSALFPEAPIYTLFYDREGTGGVFEGKEIRTSFLNRTPFVHRAHRFFPLFMPLGIEQFDFSDFDVVISISASFAKGIITKSSTKHICYCLTPPRFLWDNSHKFIEGSGYPYPIRKLLPPTLTYLRMWDREAAFRVDRFWSISKFVRERVRKYYHEESEVVYPPVNTENFSPSATIDDYFIMVGRLVGYKRFDLGVSVFNQLGLRLKIVGDGPEFKRLRDLAKGNIEFLGRVSDQELADLYGKSRALIFPQEEDFGIVPLESMASGRPVIAYGQGGAVETVVSGVTGILFSEQTISALTDALTSFSRQSFSPGACVAQAERFGIDRFKDQVKKLI